MPPASIITLPVHTRRSLDNSILSTHARCPRLDFFNYHLCRTARVENYPINFGLAYHNFRETIEKLYMSWVTEEGADLKEVQKLIFESGWSVATKDWTDPPLEHRKSYLDLGRLRRTCEEAFESWCNEKRSNYYRVIR